MSALGAVALYQTGVLNRLPDPPLPCFDSARVTRSKQAYRLFGIPDGALGLASYGLTLALAATGHETAAKLKVAADAANALRMTVREWRTFGVLCSWCMAVTAASLAGAAAAARRR